MRTDANPESAQSIEDDAFSPLVTLLPEGGESSHDALAWRACAIAERSTFAKDEADRVEHPQPGIAWV